MARKPTEANTARAAGRLRARTARKPHPADCRYLDGVAVGKLCRRVAAARPPFYPLASEGEL